MLHLEPQECKVTLILDPRAATALLGELVRRADFKANRDAHFSEPVTLEFLAGLRQTESLPYEFTVGRHGQATAFRFKRAWPVILP